MKNKIPLKNYGYTPFPTSAVHFGELPMVTTLMDDDEIPVEQNSGTKIITVADLMANFRLPFIGTLHAFTYNALSNNGNVNVPDCFLLCDGSSVNQADYPELFARIGLSYGDPGNGGFNLPNLQGRFLRGLDTTGAIDPEGLTRALGSKQDDALQNITGSFGNVGTGNQEINAPIFSNGAFVGSATSEIYTVGGSGGGQSIDVSFTFDASRVVKTSSETRPSNIAVNYYILAK